MNGNRHLRHFCVTLIILLATAGAQADFGVLDINEGDLQFLTTPPKKPPHHHSTHIYISRESLNSGWVDNKQCHYNLDQVAALQIVFRKGHVRRLEITRTENIRKAWVEDHSVQVEDIGADAVICIRSQTLSIRTGVNGTYEWRGGPYMRRFLDGYFPMKVSLAIDYPADLLSLEMLAPPEIKLRAVTLPGHIRISTLFEGRLNILALFSSRRPDENGDPATGSLNW